MKSMFCMVLAIAFAMPAAGQQQQKASERPQTIAGKVQPYIGCINRLSFRTHESEARYKSWVGKSGPTGNERVIYGLYTIYDTKDCRTNVENAARSQPSHPALEKAGADFAAAVGELEPLLKEANDYYDQKNYKDDKFAKGRELHPKLLAAWDKFNAADKTLREVVRTINDEVQAAELADVEKREGKKMRWHILTVMAKAKDLQRVESGPQDKIELAKVTPALDAYETAVKEMDSYSEKNPDEKLGSFFKSAAKEYLGTAKELMRRVRDKTKYSQGELMNLNSQGAGWMVQGSPPRLMRDYNRLIERFNSGPQT